MAESLQGLDPVGLESQVSIKLVVLQRNALLSRLWPDVLLFSPLFQTTSFRITPSSVRTYRFPIQE